MDLETKRQREQQVVGQMIRLYCQKKHGTQKGALCPDCTALESYAQHRTEKCPFMESKTFCSNCRVHCYCPDMREKIRMVMRFSGPRMLFYHPVLAIRHLVESTKEKRRRDRV